MMKAYARVMENTLANRVWQAPFEDADRGEYPRPLEEWREHFTSAFEPVVFEPYPLGAAGMTLWNMIYFKGRARR